MHQISVAAAQHEGFTEGLFQYQSHIISNHHESIFPLSECHKQTCLYLTVRRSSVQCCELNTSEIMLTS